MILPWPRRLLLFFLLAVSCALFSAPVIWSAPPDPAWQSILPGARADFRFDYLGDRTPIEVALDADGAASLDLAIHTPAQIEATRKGGALEAVGRGTPGAGHDAFWLGSFRSPGVYQVSVVNHSTTVVLYRLAIQGESVSGVGPLAPAPPPAPGAFLGSRTLTVPLPPGAGKSAYTVSVPGPPADCTHAYQVPTVIGWSIKLCPGEVYSPIRISGNGIGLYSDDMHSAVISGGGRQYAVTVEGNGNLVEGVTIQTGADAADLGAWLCQYDECVFATRPRQTVISGGTAYGGGILLQGSFSVVHGVTVLGGTIGIATVNGNGNVIVDNHLNDLNGWGIYNRASTASYFVGNELNRENHACTTPDGFKFLHGCETAGWVCLDCQYNVVARNHCEGSANCYYMSGERGLASNNNRLIANYCGGATDNCFEITFSKANLLQDNVAGPDPVTGASCKYPFWIGGSIVISRGNSWQCEIGAEEALAHAAASTNSVTALVQGAPVVFESPPPSPTTDLGSRPAARPSTVNAE